MKACDKNSDKTRGNRAKEKHCGRREEKHTCIITETRPPAGWTGFRMVVPCVADYSEVTQLHVVLFSVLTPQ